MIKIYPNDQIAAFLKSFHRRREEAGDTIELAVVEIIRQVRDRGDKALIELTLKFDRVNLAELGLQVTEKEMAEACSAIDPGLIRIIRQARENIARFHRQALPQSWMMWSEEGTILGQRVLPLERVGIYVPGGRAAYPSSLLMAAVPAQVAGVGEIVMTTPCQADGAINPVILATAVELGINKIYRLGGAQAIAAMAFGTQSVPRVDKIVGPGNAYVAAAKKILYGRVGIDMVAGPSEVVIVADETANPAFVAADLLAQSEHDPLASAILVTHRAELAEGVLIELKQQLTDLKRQSIILDSMDHYGALLITRDILESVKVANELAPEHLGLHIRDAWQHIDWFRHAGAIFVGDYSPEAVGDYWAGPNHILPTNRTARFSSPLRSEDFFKVSSLIAFTRGAIEKNGRDIQAFARCESLDAHAMAIDVRMKK